jgi:nitrogen regulatory protein P-II 1
VKLVIGIVRPEKANDVLESLYRAEVRGVSMSRVQGHGASSSGWRPTAGPP